MIASYPSSRSMRSTEVAMLEILFLAVGITLFCLYVAYERLSNRL